MDAGRSLQNGTPHPFSLQDTYIKPCKNEKETRMSKAAGIFSAGYAVRPGKAHSGTYVGRY